MRTAIGLVNGKRTCNFIFKNNFLSDGVGMAWLVGLWYTLDDPEFDFKQGQEFFFSVMPRLAVGPGQVPIQGQPLAGSRAGGGLG